MARRRRPFGEPSQGAAWRGLASRCDDADVAVEASGHAAAASSSTGTQHGDPSLKHRNSRHLAPSYLQLGGNRTLLLGGTAGEPGAAGAATLKISDAPRHGAARRGARRAGLGVLCGWPTPDVAAANGVADVPG